MGYKLAGFDVIGCEELDPRMMDLYDKNHHPKFKFLEDIRDFAKRESYPDELTDLDILDGSPPCSSFSMAGSREDGWGKEKKFREGQKLQVLDDLFFDYIALAKRLKPKVVIAENVKGILLGDAVKYSERILAAFEDAGYHTEFWELDSSVMGVPQRRTRVFFIGIRHDIAEAIPGPRQTLFSMMPALDLEFKMEPIPFKEVRSENGSPQIVTDYKKNLLANRTTSDKCIADIKKRVLGKDSEWNALIVQDDDICPTIVCSSDLYRYCDTTHFSDSDLFNCGSFPIDYDLNGNKAKYVVGMSVPPFMIKGIAERIWGQWLSKVSNQRKLL